MSKSLIYCKEGRKMNRKAVSGIMLTLLFIGLLTLSFDIQPAKAYGPIYIRANGSVEPSTAPISSVDNITYAFTDNIADPIVVERSNIMVDGSGYTLQGSGSGKGFSLSGIGNVTIKNANIKGFSRGVKLTDSSYNSLYHNNIINNKYYGVWLDSSSNNSVSGNNITNSDHAVYLSRSSNNSVSGNNITNSDHALLLSRSSNNSVSGNNITNSDHAVIFYLSPNNSVSGNELANNEDYGVRLDLSSKNVLKDNSIVGSRYGFGVFDSYAQDVDTSNTVDGKPIYYLFNQHNLAINPFTHPDIGYLALIDSYNVTVEALQLKKNGQGILLVNTTSSRITNNNITYNQYGVHLSLSSNNTVSGNELANNGAGVYLYSSFRNSVSGNNITDNYRGISLDESSNNSVSGNNITNNGVGISLGYSSYNNIVGNNITNSSFNGVRLGFSSNNTISGNNITNNRYGFYLLESSNNTISGNNIANNTWAVYLYWSLSNNTISGNNITNNGVGVYLCWSLSNNTISGNNIANNTWAVYLYSSSRNSIHHNNFINNTGQAKSYNSTNVWDDGYPSGGNYWSDYEKRYPNATEIDGSGTWDTPYIIDDGNQDNYPLMEPWTPKPPTPTEASEELIETIQTSNLTKGTESSLVSKLKAGIQLLELGNENGAIHKLMDFMDQVEAQRGKKLTDEQADYLMSEAQRIIDLIEG